MESLNDILKRANLARSERIEDRPEPTVCSICHGAGYLRFDVPIGDPRFGEVVVCECTRKELADRRQAMLVEKSQLADLKHFSFGNFNLKFRTAKPTVGTPDYAFHMARQFAKNPGADGHPWLFLYGMKGTGKTHLAAAIGNSMIERANPAIFMVVADLLDHLRATFSPDSDVTYDELFESLRNTPMLILDDLGTHNATPWAREKLYQLINHRYNRRQPTVITMDMEVEEVDPRLWSRINDAQLTTVCEIRASDVRTPVAAPGQNLRQRRKVREQQL